jgi:hypothetical protein
MHEVCAEKIFAKIKHKTHLKGLIIQNTLSFMQIAGKELASELKIFLKTFIFSLCGMGMGGNSLAYGIYNDMKNSCKDFFHQGT